MVPGVIVILSSTTYIQNKTPAIFKDTTTNQHMEWNHTLTKLITELGFLQVLKSSNPWHTEKNNPQLVNCGHTVISAYKHCSCKSST